MIDVMIGESVAVGLQDSVAMVTLNRPGVLNALTVDMLDELADGLRTLADDRQVSVVVVIGAGRAFCAGVDLTMLQSRELAGGRIGDDFDSAAAAVTGLLEGMPKPTIAAINGACFTGGLELALACDIIIAADEAMIGDTHARWGLRPTWGMSQRLIRRVGPARARLLSFTARPVNGVEAAEIGLAVDHAPASIIRNRALALGNEIASNSGGALAAYKALYAIAEGTPIHEGLHLERSLEFPIDDSRSRIHEFVRSRRGTQ